MRVDQDTGVLLEDTSYTFDARTFALTWLTVASAASEDDERPLLYRAVNVELDESGVRLTATDSYRFWSWWVGERPKAKEPDYELPRGAHVTVSDSDFRARDLMKYVVRATKKEDAPLLTMSVAFGKAPAEVGQILGLERDVVTLTVTSTAGGALHESLLLTLIDGDYPNIRSLYNDHEPALTERVSFNPVLLTKMMKAVPGSEEMPCTFVLGGSDRPMLVQPFGTEGSWPLRGLIMPMRLAS